MSVRMIVTDLDQTLLQTDKTISRYTAAIMKQCRAKGIRVIFATARPKRTVNRFLTDVSVDGLVLHNGAVVYAENKHFVNYGIDSETKNNILKSISHDHPQAILSVEIDDTLYANFDVKTIWPETEAVRTDFSVLPDKPADNIIVGVSSLEDIVLFSKYLPDNLYIEMNDGKLGLIMSKAATKWNAVKALADHFSISTGDVVAFGDDYNDIEMIRLCGTGVAVVNALDEAKAVADFICGSNDDDGVARWLEENVLLSVR